MTKSESFSSSLEMLDAFRLGSEVHYRGYPFWCVTAMAEMNQAPWGA
jgi:hypothetical protein